MEISQSLQTSTYYNPPLNPILSKKNFVDKKEKCFTCRGTNSLSSSSQSEWAKSLLSRCTPLKINNHLNKYRTINNQIWTLQTNNARRETKFSLALQDTRRCTPTGLWQKGGPSVSIKKTYSRKGLRCTKNKSWFLRAKSFSWTMTSYLLNSISPQSRTQMKKEFPQWKEVSQWVMPLRLYKTTFASRRRTSSRRIVLRGCQTTSSLKRLRDWGPLSRKVWWQGLLTSAKSRKII